MNEKQLADRLRDIADHAADADVELRLLADELDPPQPDPGTVVIRSDGVVGFVRDKATVYFHNGGGMRWDNLGTQWKPACILGPRQVAVDVPPVAEWLEWANQIVAAYRNSETGQNGIVTDIITRTDAERMEASDE